MTYVVTKPASANIVLGDADTFPVTQAGKVVAASMATLRAYVQGTGSPATSGGGTTSTGSVATAATAPSPVPVTTPASQNLVLYSEDFTDASWNHFPTANPGNVTVTANTDPGPTGGASTADRLLFSAINSGLYFNTNVTGQYTHSVWARALSGSGAFCLGYYGNSSGGVGVVQQPMTATSTWQRFSYTFSGDGDTYSNISIGLNGTQATGGTLEFWGAQLNAGATALPYLPTTGAAATSAAVYGARVGAAIAGLTSTVTPSGATAWACLYDGTADVGSRVSFTGTSIPSLTPATANATHTIRIYSAATGGTLLATSATFSVGAATVSPAGSLVTTVGPIIVDSIGNVMSISSAGLVVTNGTPEDGLNGHALTSNVNGIYWNGTNFFQRNTSGNWYERTSLTTYNGPVSDPTAAAPAASAYFQAKNGKLYDPAGNVFVAKGVNVTPYTGYSPSYFTAIKALFPKINYVRLVTQDGWSAGGQDSGVVYQFIADATAAKVAVMIDNHRTGQALSGTALTNATAWYSALATKYLNNPYVLFNTCNEPAGDAATIAAEQLAVYNAIRGTGNNTVLFCALRGGAETAWMSGLASTWTQMHNVGREVHFYDPFNGATQNQATVTANLQSTITAAQAYQSADGVMPVHIGEFGPSITGAASSTDPNAAEVLTTVFGLGAGYTAWAWNGTSTPGGDSLSDDGSTLTTWGQQLATAMSNAVLGQTAPVSTSGIANSLPAPVGSASNTFPQATGSDVQVYLAKPQGWNVPASLYGISCGHMSLDGTQKYSALATTNLQNAIKSLKFGLIRLNWDKATTMGYAFDGGSFDSSSVDTFINNAGVFSFPSTQLIITIGWSSAVGSAIDAGNVDSVTATHQSQCNQMAAYFKSKGLTGIYWEMVNEPDAEQTSDMLTLAKVFNAMRAGIKAADSTAKCGGVTSSYRNDGQITNWYNNCSPKPDFVTWHSYLSSGLNEAEAVTLNKVLGANTNFASLRSSLGGFTGPMGDTERNWNGTPTDNAPQNRNVVGACFMAADQITQIQGDHNAVFNATWDIWGDATYGMIDYSDYHVYPTGLLLTRLTTTMPGEALGMSLGSGLTGSSVSNGSSTGVGHLLGLATVLNGKAAVELVNIGDGALTANLVLNGFTGSSVTRAEHSPANPNGITSTLAVTGGTGVAVTVPAKSCVVVSG